MFEALTAALIVLEADVPHMYLDTRGNVTVGVGHLLATVQEAYGLPFLLPTGSPAEQHDILNDFEAIKQSKPGMLVQYYARAADLRLSAEDRQKLLRADIQRTHTDLQRDLPVLSDLPEPAQEAVLNMAFELGPRGLMEGYPKLIKALHESDWQQCAAECRIADASVQRNMTNKKFFLSIV